MEQIDLLLREGVWQRHQRVTVMKREIARGLFLLGTLAIASVALAAWEQPVTQVLSGAGGGDSCPLPRVAKVSRAATPDHDLLLFMFGMTQGMKSQG